MTALRLTIVVAALALAGCHQGNGLGQGDLSPPADLLPAPDLTPPPDMVPPPTCGKIVFCALQCLGGAGLGGGGAADAGVANLGCVLGCGQNAPPAQVTAALTLVGCAAQNCLQNGAGGNQLQIFMCLSMKCSTQLAGCQGIGIGGM